MSSEPIMQAAEYPYTFSGEDGSITINFGVLTGREATQAEIDRLAQLLATEADAGPDITIVSCRRQDYGAGIETIAHQVHVTVTGHPSAEVERQCRDWVMDCADDRRITPLDRFPN
jgi:hypothetical protein